MFGLFEKKKTIYDEIRDFAAYQKTNNLIEKANNLLKLGRSAEAVEILSEAEQIALNSVRSSPDSFQANLLLAFFYTEAQLYDHAEDILENLLNSGRFTLDKEQRFTLESELQKMQREKAIAGKVKGNSPIEITNIFSCQNCGRIINFVTIPCPHCQWYPPDLLSFARSFLLSNAHIEVPALLLLAREVTNGRSPSEVVTYLDDQAMEFYRRPESDTNLKLMFNLLQQNANKNIRNMQMVRECPNCGDRILLSHEEKCGSCGLSIGWPESIKLLVCMDNLMWLFEQKADISNSSEFSEFVCLVELMTDKLLRKQEAPSQNQRKLALRLMHEMKSFTISNRGAAIETTNPEKLKIYVVGSIEKNLVEDNTLFGMFFHSELEFFVGKMVNGISL
jgi:ribosomal protein S27AE